LIKAGLQFGRGHVAGGFLVAGADALEVAGFGFGAQVTVNVVGREMQSLPDDVGLELADAEYALVTGDEVAEGGIELGDGAAFAVGGRPAAGVEAAGVKAQGLDLSTRARGGEDGGGAEAAGGGGGDEGFGIEIEGEHI
jgi:hypothetical protein